MEAVTVVAHPLAGDLLARLRTADTPPERFRHLARRLATVLVLEATRSLATRETPVRTPVAATTGRQLAGSVVAVPVLRAGLGMLEAATDLLPDVSVGYVGLQRDETTLEPSTYYVNVPAMRGRPVLLLDPMLATGGSAVAAARLLKERGATDIRLVCVVAAPEGLDRVAAEHPDVPVVSAAVDERLDDRGYIVPGLGDFGDRLYGTA
ncbi:MAG: uracil phosphoribosyltransferase [Egibacteraceae bacterium]